MSDKKFSIEDILNEYPSDRSRVRYSKKAVPETPSGRMETQEMLESVETGQSKKAADSLQSTRTFSTPGSWQPVSETKTAAREEDREAAGEISLKNVRAAEGDRRFEPSSTDDIVETIKKTRRERAQKEAQKEAQRQSFSPVRNIHPDSLLRSRISFVKTMNESKETAESSGYDGIVSKNGEDSDYDSSLPKIRRMNDSTRARENEKSKSKKKNKRAASQENYGYKKDTPEGAYIKESYLTPEVHKKKKTRSVDSDTKHIPFKGSDYIESNNAGRSKHSSEDAKFDLDSFDKDKTGPIDIPIEEKKPEKKKNKKSSQKSKKQDRSSSEPENRAAISREIRQLKAALFTRISVLTVLCAAGLLLLAANHFHLPFFLAIKKAVSMRGIAVIYGIFGTGAILASFPTIKYGIKRLFSFNSDCDTLPALAMVASTVTAFAGAFAPQLLDSGMLHLFVPVAILGLIINAYGKQLILNRAQKNIRFISRGAGWNALVTVGEETNAYTLSRGILSKYPVIGTLKKTDYLTDFLRYTYSTDNADRFCRIVSPIMAGLSLAVAVVISYIKYPVMSLAETLGFGLSVFSALLILTSCMAVPLVVNIPLMNGAKKFSSRDGAILGYQGVEDMYDTNAVLVTADKLFSPDTVKLRGLKIISDIQIEENLFSAVSLANYANSIIKDTLAEDLVDMKRDYYDVKNFKYEDSVGLCGWIRNKRVLLGSREMMKNHSIEGVPSPEKERKYCGDLNAVPVYLAVSGNLSALFIIEFTKDQKIESTLNALKKNDINVIVKSIDFMVTHELLRKLYGGAESNVKVIPENIHSIFDEESKPCERVSASVICSGKLSGISRLLTGIKHIRQAASLGVAVQLISAILGILIGAIYIFTNSYKEMTVSMLLLYQVLFTVITVLISKIRKV